MTAKRSFNVLTLGQLPKRTPARSTSSLIWISPSTPRVQTLCGTIEAAWLGSAPLKRLATYQTTCCDSESIDQCRSQPCRQW
jgi:hypothetical protein